MVKGILGESNIRIVVSEKYFWKLQLDIFGSSVETIIRETYGENNPRRIKYKNSCIREVYLKDTTW